MHRPSFVFSLLVSLCAVTSAAQAQVCEWKSDIPNYLYENCGRVVLGPYPQLTVKDPTVGHSVFAMIQRDSAGPNAGLVIRTGANGVNTQWTIGKSGAANQETLYFSLNANGDEFGDPKVVFWNNGY